MSMLTCILLAISLFNIGLVSSLTTWSLLPSHPIA